jgi:hypothetical protein
MPIPIRLVNMPENNSEKPSVDYSFLYQQPIEKESSKKVITATDREAELLMKIWDSAEKTSEGRFRLSSKDISDSDFCRLRSSGFVSGGMDCCEFTKRAKQIVKVMTLGESNSFLKKRIDKSYNEILAQNKTRFKKGYRISKTSQSSQPKEASDENLKFKLTRKEWENIGDQMGWTK